ncbi:MAG: hypothetical protein OXH68_18625 [Gammaproteobacteria bacterium]|nr:hypothetical protein [Gammaproteobacteria bacterium]
MTGKSKGALQYDDLAAWLIEEIPELEDAYKREMEWWGQERPGPHIIFGDVLTPYIILLLESGERTQATKRVFSVLETMLADHDIEVQSVAVVTVFERLVGNRDWLRSMKAFAGPRAREAVRDLIEGSESERDW